MAWLWPRYPYNAPLSPAFTVEHISDNPLISSDGHPSLAEDADSQLYLYYVGGGEQGIGVVKLRSQARG